jgi:AraC-like DNA-binding protein
MSYREFPPHPALINFIDAYWTIETDHVAGPATIQRILPDGCTDIIFNKGNHVYRPDQDIALRSAETYLIGTMSTFSETIGGSDQSLLGIRFRPGCFRAFFPLDLHEVTDLATTFRVDDLREIVYGSLDLLTDLNLYFLKRVPRQALASSAVLAEIGNSKGNIRVAELLNHHAMSERKMERLFKREVGLSMKGMIRLTRFIHTLDVIRCAGHQRNLSAIAYSCGYYDQAHLCAEVKRYSGLTPSQL